MALWNSVGQVANIAQLVGVDAYGLISMIVDAARTVKRNRKSCQRLAGRVKMIGDLLQQLQGTQLMQHTDTRIPMEKLEETLRHTYILIKSCQGSNYLNSCFRCGEHADQLREVEEEIDFCLRLFPLVSLVDTSRKDRPAPSRDQPLQTEGTVDELPEEHHPEPEDRMEGLRETKPEDTGTHPPQKAQEEETEKALIQFNFLKLMAATNGFSDNNIINRGSYYTTYKGVIYGSMVAIRKISDAYSKHWAQHYEQLLLASKLQHKNIVKVVGWSHRRVRQKRSFMPCLKDRIVRETKSRYFIVEEYMPNGRLSEIIYNQESKLGWTSIFRIIVGTAQGLHYLHGQRVIHRDVTPGSILLDSDMNPVITDFQLALVLDANSETIEDHVAGITCCVSRKADVYDFGITVLGTINCIRRCKQSRRVRDPHKWAVEAWKAGRIEEEFDPALFDESQLTEIKRCVEVGLMCCIKNREDRPIMADVLEMLNGQKEVPTPKSSDEWFMWEVPEEE